MKNLVALQILLLLTWSTAASAQFPNFPDSNAFWRMDVMDQPGIIGQFGYHMRGMNNDTLLGGQWYGQLWVGAESDGGAFAGGIREDGEDRVYFFDPSWNMEYLLYDFNPEIGDSMMVYLGHTSGINNGDSAIMHIESIEVLLNANGAAYNKIGIMSNNAIAGGQGVSQYWIQGVGGTGGLFSTIGALSLSPNTYLGCMEHNDTLWPGGLPGNCSWTVGVHDENEQIRAIATPNPSTGLFTIGTAPTAYAISVITSTGQLVWQGHGNTIDLMDQQPGVYTAIVVTERNRQAVRLMVMR